MKPSLVGAFIGSAIIGVLALTPIAAAKTAKECQAEWRANKAANQAKGITEKAYVDECRGEKAKAAPASNAKEEKASTEKKKETSAKEKPSSKMAAPAAGEKKTVKACEEEWRANKAANQAKGITQKAYVEQCRAGTAAMTPPPPAPMQKMTPPPASAPKETKMAPPQTTTAKPAASTAKPGMGKPEGANQFAAESGAKAHCPTGLVVWANLDSKIYHFAGHADYGHTKQGAYMCEKDAEAQGMRAAKNEKHP
jgi:glucan-binding YG repeat protein